MKFWTFVIALLLANSAYTTTFFEVDTTCAYNATFSKWHHDRIAYEGGRILKVIYPSDLIWVNQEELSGQVFVTASDETPEELILSIVLDSGVIQDLIVQFGDVPSEVVIFKDPNQKNCGYEICKDPESEIQRIVDVVLNGKIPEGFTAFPIKGYSKVLKKGVYIQEFSRMYQGDEVLQIFKICNRTSRSVALKESEINTCRSNWVFLEKNCLGGHETILAIRSVRKM